MATLLNLPTASLFDPVDSSEGSLDPLGLYAISESLASRLASPGIRERHRNLRFLTICAIGWEVIASVPHVEDPGDPTATLEQAFEWLVVEALAAAAKDDRDALQGLPGATKARACIEDGIHLNADRYLRMASVFGFFGVYRTLAEYLHLVARDSEQMPVIAEAGAGLLGAWRKEQRLPGFGRGLEGAGQREYRAVVGALTEAWRKGQAVSDRHAAAFIQGYLWHSTLPGALEGAELRRIIVESGREESDDNRRELMRALAEPAARKLMKEGLPDSEPRFHSQLLEHASPRLKASLSAVRVYEDFSIALQSLFDDLLFGISAQPGLVPIGVAARGIPNLEKRARELPEVFARSLKTLQGISGLGIRFDRLFGRFAAPLSGVDCIRELIGHHAAVQEAKPPKGKALWFERSDDRIAVRLRYKRDEGAAKDGRYVSFYRSRPLFNLLGSLEKADGAP